VQLNSLLSQMLVLDSDLPFSFKIAWLLYHTWFSMKIRGLVVRAFACEGLGTHLFVKVPRPGDSKVTFFGQFR